MNKYVVVHKDDIKYFVSPDMSYIFNSNNGYFAIWGETKDDDPPFSKYGPTILDIEVTEVCSGIGDNGPCDFCYKANSPHRGKVMNFELFKHIFDMLPQTITQIAFGADAKCESCPDIFKMMKYCRENRVVPNITVADVNEEIAQELAKYVGAVSVSWYGDWEIFYDSIKNLHKAGVKQINIHNMVSEQTHENTLRLLMKWDELKNMVNAIVFLSLKKCGRAKTGYDTLDFEKFVDIIKYCLNNNIPFGSDSCGCHKIERAIIKLGFRPSDELLQLLEPCESTCFSAYCNAEGVFFPCSFNEKRHFGIDAKELNTKEDFMKYIWYGDKTVEFRNVLLKFNRSCPTYEV